MRALIPQWKHINVVRLYYSAQQSTIKAGEELGERWKFRTALVCPHLCTNNLQRRYPPRLLGHQLGAPPSARSVMCCIYCKIWRSRDGNLSYNRSYSLISHIFICAA